MKILRNENWEQGTVIYVEEKRGKTIILVQLDESDEICHCEKENVKK